MTEIKTDIPKLQIHLRRCLQRLTTVYIVHKWQTTYLEAVSAKQRVSRQRGQRRTIPMMYIGPILLWQQ